ncbi:hypothetical protein GH714_034243 [Hevea brasiliensis]|uniref:Uncharacterized protein n=1 Tax=Hevea brasiliensis TaxID=3981 RepID=A0A6A6KZR9_HEVBR|nr:hypothetical protein GH714_034243 [Hevea brasiliensis]
MDRACEELDEAKAEIEKLRVDLKCKAELSENLKKAHNDRIIKIQQANSKIEKQTQELSEKAEEICVARKMCEDLQCSLNEKDSIIRRLSSSNDELRVDCDEKHKKWEEERRGLLLALDEANEKNIDKEQKINTSLDSQTRISDDLQNQLKMCNQALAHEESRRKYLETEICEFKSRFETAFTECQDAKSQLERLTAQRDKEIAALRHSLGTKETFYKEIEYRAGKLEQENQELLESLKELQEAQIHEVGNSSSLAKLRNKLKRVEQMHQDCSANLRAKEAEWSSQLEKLTQELNGYRSALESKETEAKELELELENCHSAIMQLELRNEEASVMLLVLKSELEEAHLTHKNAEVAMNLHDKERDETVSLLMRQLEMKNTALAKALESKKEWELEKSALIDQICSLQTSLDSQTRISDDLQNQLKMCNQALAHEESRRKYLETEICEFKSRFETAFTECQDAKSQLERLTTQRDKEIAALRHSLGTKETFYKEIEYRAGKLEQENQELLESLKELQEAQIHEVGNSSSLAKLRNKLKRVEQMHQDCSANLRAKEAEWSSQLEKLTQELNGYRSALESKETAAKELELELENCHSAIMQLELRNEEASVMLLVLKSELEEAHLTHKNAEVAMNLHDKERDETVSLLMRQLEMKNTALAKALEDNNEERQKAAALLKRVESLDFIEEQKLLLEKELERCKEILQESSMSQLHFKEQALQTERELQEKIRELCDALDMANSELTTEREKAVSLSMKAAYLVDTIEEKRQLMEKELEQYSEMLQESSRKQIRLEEQAFDMETDFKEKLREVCDALDNANSELHEEREKVASLLRRVESFNFIEEQQNLMQKELGRYKQMIEESSKCQLHLQKEALQKESDSQEKLQEVCAALDRANSELALKICEVQAVEFELWIWKSIAQRLNDDLEENQALRKELEASLLAQVEVGETFKQELKSRESEAAASARMEAVMSFELEKESFLRTMREKDMILEDLQKEIGWLEEESLRRDFEDAVVAHVGAERTLEFEKENFRQLLEEKDIA